MNVSGSPRRMAVAAAAMLAVTALLFSAGCVAGVRVNPAEGRGGISVPVVGQAGANTPSQPAKQVLERTVEKLLSLKSYRYRGTTELIIQGQPDLNNTATFDTTLVQNDSGGLDGHMVVDAEGGGSYETYSYDGIEYTRMEGEGWYRVNRGSSESGYGMVSQGARRIIAEFADLAEDVRCEGETAEDYSLSLRMGDRYCRGAAEIAGTGHSRGTSAPKDTTMTICVDKKTMCMKSATMKDSGGGSNGIPSVTTITKGTYSEFNEPVDITPPPEAQSAPFKDPEDAPSTQQYQ